MRGEKKTLDKKGENLKLRKIAQKQKMKERGITLIALVVTIVILLILAGVTLNIALSNNGLFNKAKTAADEYNQKSLEEELQILFAEKQMENYENKSSGKADVTELLEEKLGEGNITQEDIDEFNVYLEKYQEKITPISNAGELEKIGQDNESGLPIDGIYVQMSDISLENFTPIGTREKPFTGVFNGNGKKISSLTITGTNDSAGMFGASEGTIKNVTIESCNIDSNGASVGAIAGINMGLIENCTITEGKVNSAGLQTETGFFSAVGGICGSVSDKGMVKNCVNSADVSGSYKLVGGICGYMPNGTIQNCINKGNVKGPFQIGGICGCAGIGSSIQRCKNEGTVSEAGNINKYTNRHSGGIVGQCTGTIVEECVNSGNMVFESTYSFRIGGIVGYLISGSSISCCYNLKGVSGKKNVGGIVGCVKGPVDRCYSVGEVKSLDGSTNVGGAFGMLDTEYISKDNITNCYCLDTSCEIACGTDATLNSSMKKEASDMESLADILKDPFVKNDNGYPKLNWE